MNYIIKIVKSLKESGLLIKGVIETVIQNEAKKQKCRFPSMLFGTLAVSLLGNLLTSKGFKWLNSSNIPGRGAMRVTSHN